MNLISAQPARVRAAPAKRFRRQDPLGQMKEEHGTYCWRRSAQEQAGADLAHLHLRNRRPACGPHSQAANVDPFKKVQDLGEDEVNRIRQVIEQEGDVEGDARKDVSMHIKRLIDIQSYRGNRHRRNLPVRGQRSHTNARTRKGPRKGTVAGKKKATKT